MITYVASKADEPCPVRSMFEAQGANLAKNCTDPSLDLIVLTDTDGGAVDPFLYHEETKKDTSPSNFLRDLRELTIVRHAIAEKIPIVGIGRGAQLLWVACGGKLRQDLDENHLSLPAHGLAVPQYHFPYNNSFKEQLMDNLVGVTFSNNHKQSFSESSTVYMKVLAYFQSAIAVPRVAEAVCLPRYRFLGFQPLVYQDGEEQRSIFFDLLEQVCIKGE
jgi:gamma-glutamyl-gamma-aminobutyrate hydrolase PuuD